MADMLKPERRLPTYGKTLLTWGRSTRWARDGADGTPATAFRVLFYHRVSDDQDLLAVTPRAFRRQMDLLAAEGRRVVDLVTAWDELRAGRLAPGTVALNFDDGYRDIAEHALPVLREHGFAATVFIAPGLTDGTAPLPWYRDPPALLGWDEIRELQGADVVFEPHSLTHRKLTALDEETARREIEGSREVLEERLGRRPRAFCYPAGLAGPRERRLVAEAGLDVAVSCEPGPAVAEDDPQWVPRLGVGRYDRIADVRAKLRGAHDRPLPGRALYQAVRYGRSAA